MQTVSVGLSNVVLLCVFQLELRTGSGQKMGLLASASCCFVFGKHLNRLMSVHAEWLPASQQGTAWGGEGIVWDPGWHIITVPRVFHGNMRSKAAAPLVCSDSLQVICVLSHRTPSVGYRPPVLQIMLQCTHLCSMVTESTETLYRVQSCRPKREGCAHYWVDCVATYSLWPENDSVA